MAKKQKPRPRPEREYTFTIKTTGRGRTPEKAWVDAIDMISNQLDEFLDTEDVPDYEIGDVIDED